MARYQPCQRGVDEERDERRGECRGAKSHLRSPSPFPPSPAAEEAEEVRAIREKEEEREQRGGTEKEREGRGGFGCLLGVK